MDRSVAPVHLDGHGHWIRVTEPHTPARIQELVRLAIVFDDGFYRARRYAENDGYPGLRRHGDRLSAASYADHRDYCLNFTDDEVLAAHIALLVAGPARSSIYEVR